MKKYKHFIFTIIWMIFIFIMSHTPGNESSNQSSFFADIISKFIDIDYNLLTFLIRKAAHMTEYAILFTTIFYGLFKYYQKHLYLIPLLVTFLYACTDEIHQLFIPGRAGQFQDVLIDTSGALIALIIIYLYQKISSSKDNEIA